MEKPTFVYATYIRTTPEKLWKALTDGGFSEQYWFGFRIDVEPRTGGRVRIVAPEGEKVCGDLTGEVLAWEPGRKLAYTWSTKDEPAVAAKRRGPSRVTFELTPVGPQVRLRVIHENLLPEDLEADPNAFRGINNGWTAVISSLKSLLETGEAIRFSAA